MTYQQVQPKVAVIGFYSGLNPFSGLRLQLRSAGGMGIQMQGRKPIAIRDFAYRQTRQDVLEQLRDLGHQLMIIETGAIPLQQRKFRIVTTPFLTVSKHFTERVNRSTASGQQTLHGELDRKSTRLNSSHVAISYAVFCLKKKNTR